MPGANTYVFEIGFNNGPAGIAYKQSDGKLYCATGTIGSATFGSTGISVSVDTWYRIDVKVDYSTGTSITVDAKVDGSDLGGRSGYDGGGFSLQGRIGPTNTVTCDLYTDDILISHTSGDYPLGAGFVKSYIPNGDGTHSSLGSFGDLAGNSLSDGTVYQHLDKRPITTGDTAVQQEAGSDTAYIEVTFEESTDGAPRTVDALIGIHAESTSGCDPRYWLVSGAVEDTIFEGSPGSATVIWKRKHYPQWNSAAWTEAAFDALTFRFGSALDANPDPHVDAIMLEAEFSEGVTHSAEAVLAASATVVALAGFKLLVDIVLNAAATLAAATEVLRLVEAGLNAQASVTPNARLTVSAEIGINAASTLTADATVTRSADITISGTATLTALAGMVKVAEASLNAAANPPLGKLTSNQLYDVLTGADDGHIEGTDFDNAQQHADFGKTAGGASQNAFIRFADVAIPKGASIVSAYVEIAANNYWFGATCNVSIQCEDADDPSPPSSYSDYNARTLTSAIVYWNSIPEWEPLTYYSTPDISAVIQEIIDRVGWAVGNAITVFIKDNGSGTNQQRNFLSKDVDTNNPRLKVTYLSDDYFNASLIAHPVVAFTAVATLTADASVSGEVLVDIALQATATLGATATGTRTVEAAFSSLATLTADAVIVKEASAVLEATGTLSANIGVTRGAEAALSALATLVADAQVQGEILVDAALQATATLAADAVATYSAEAAFTAIASLTADATILKPVSAALTGTATLTAAAVRTLSAAASFLAVANPSGGGSGELHLQIGVSTDDGHIEGTSFLTNNDWISWGKTTGGISRSAYCRFPSITIPQGTTIQTAVIEFISAFAIATGGTNARIRAEAADNPTAPTSNADFVARTRTTAYVDWNDQPAQVINVPFDTPDFTNVLQEIVNRAGWASGNAIIIFLDDNGSATSGRRSGDSWDWSSGRAPKLDVTYGSAAVNYFTAILILGPVITLASAASLTADAVVIASAEASLASSGNLVADASLIGQLFAEAVLPAVATVTAIASMSLPVEAAFTSSASLAADAVVLKLVDITLGTTASLVADIALTLSAASTLSSTASLSATPAGSIAVDTVLASTATLAATVLLTIHPTASLSTTAALSATSLLTLGVASVLASTGSLTAVPLLTVGVAFTLTGSASLAATVVGLISTSASVTGTATLTPTAGLILLVSATLPATATLTADSVIVKLVAVTLSATATVTATTILIIPASTSLQAVATLAAASVLSASLQAALLGSAVLSAFAVGRYFVSSQLQGVITLVASPEIPIPEQLTGTAAAIATAPPIPGRATGTSLPSATAVPINVPPPGGIKWP